MYNFHISNVLELHSVWVQYHNRKQGTLFVRFGVRIVKQRVDSGFLVLILMLIIPNLLLLTEQNVVLTCLIECPHCELTVLQFNIMSNIISKLPLQIGSVDQLIFPMWGFQCKLYYTGTTGTGLQGDTGHFAS